MAQPTPPTILTSADVRAMTFSATRFKPGYDEDEVDDFLDTVESSLDLLHAELDAQRSAASGASAASGTPGTDPAIAATEAGQLSSAAGTAEMEEMLRRTLLLAQRTADQAVAEAREQAEKTTLEAREQAQRLISDAIGRAEAAEREAAARAEALLSEADAQRRALESRVEALRGFEREYRARLRAYFELQLRELEAITGTAPSGADVTPRSSGAASDPAPVAALPLMADVLPGQPVASAPTSLATTTPASGSDVDDEGGPAAGRPPAPQTSFAELVGEATPPAPPSAV
jgi:DivIVA domain-containing protein